MQLWNKLILEKSENSKLIRIFMNKISVVKFYPEEKTD
jgi:hypothetical protein